MVKNDFKILDENIIKFLTVKEYNMTKHNIECLARAKSKRTKNVRRELNEETLEYNYEEIHNEEYKEPPAIIRFALKRARELDYNIMNYNCDKSNKKWTVTIEERNQRFFQNCEGEEVVYDYLDIIPFTPSVMINISPDWGAVDKRSDTCKIKLLSEILEGYLREGGRYTKAQYIIENGSEGDHIHCHCVAQMNPKILKSVRSHLGRGNHTAQLIKQANKLKGMKGMIKGTGIQINVLQNEEIIKDKIDYLDEEKKPEGHKNKSIIGTIMQVVF